MTRTITLLLGVLWFHWSAPSAANGATVDITGCMQSIPTLTTGIVQADLDCTGTWVVDVGRNGRLDLNGHTIIGTVGSLFAKKFEVTGPGTIVGSIILNQVTRKLSVKNLAIDADGWGIFAGTDHRVTIIADNVTISGATIAAIEASKVKLHSVHLDDNPLDHPTLSRGSAVFAYKISGDDVSASGNGIPHTPCPGCAALYAFGTAKLDGLQAIGNAGYGAFGVSLLRLENSTVTGNNGVGLGIDVAAGGNLMVSNTTCGLSGHSEPPYAPGYWGVCTND